MADDFPLPDSGLPDSGPKREAWTACHLNARLGQFDSNKLEQSLFDAKPEIDTAALENCLKETEAELLKRQPARLSLSLKPD